jgi:polypeptide N-acetylgalactosaminyltransferase
VFQNTEIHVVAFLRESLDEHVAKLPVPTRVLRTHERVGLVRARLMGAKEAQGQILTFLDAHCECTTGMYETWLRTFLSWYQ